MHLMQGVFLSFKQELGYLELVLSDSKHDLHHVLDPCRDLSTV